MNIDDNWILSLESPTAFWGDLPISFWLVTTALVGLAVGSFLNVVAYRLPLMMERTWRADCATLLDQPVPQQASFNLVVPRSRCPHCNHLITAWENIPVISYLLLGGRCSHCGANISIQYPLVEAITALLSLVTVWVLGPGPYALAALVLTWALIALTVIDLQTQLLPDAITQPLLWLGLLLALNHVTLDLDTAVTGAVAGYLSLWSVYWVFKLLTGKEGMGYGDFKLLAALGAWLGWQMLPAVILLSAGVGALTGMALILLGRQGREQPLPFGPFLAAAGWIALLWGEDINRLYLDFAGL